MARRVQRQQPRAPRLLGLAACTCGLSALRGFCPSSAFVAARPALQAGTRAAVSSAPGAGALAGSAVGPLVAPLPGGGRRGRAVGAARSAGEKELDVDALTKYAGALVIQLAAITAFFAALDAAAASLPEPVPQWAIFVLFFGLSLRSRFFSPLDNSRPDLDKAVKGEATGGFNDRIMPSWTPPGITFPIMWVLIVAPLRAASSMLVWEQVGHLCDANLLALVLHLSIGDMWNTINNVERRLGAAVPGVLCVWLSGLFAAYTYYQVVPFAGQLLLPMCLWLTVAATLIADTWRVNNTAGDEPIYPYKGSVTTEFWFAAK